MITRLAILTSLIVLSVSAKPLDDARELQSEINGGANRPVEIYVRKIKNVYVLEGSVDKAITRQVALQNCSIYARYKERYKSEGFANPDEMCISRIRIRAAPPESPPVRIFVEYKILFLPDTSLSADELMKGDYTEVSSLNRNALQLATVAQQVLDAKQSLSDDRTIASLPSNESSQLLNIDARAKDIFDNNKDYTFETITKSFGYEGTDYLNLESDVRILEAKQKDVTLLKVHSNVKVKDSELAPIAVLQKLKGSKVNALVVLVKAMRVR